MAKVIKMSLFYVMLLIVVVECHPQPPDYFDPTEPEIVPRGGCSEEFESLRNEIIEKSKCAPREVLVHLKPPTRYEEVSPGAIMVKRCVGICTFETTQDDTCVPTKTVKIPIHVKINSAKTGLSRCATYMVEEHESCSCSCKLAPEKCGYDPRKIVSDQENEATPEFAVESI